MFDDERVKGDKVIELCWFHLDKILICNNDATPHQ
jgi:hypothetical protein